MEPRVIVGIVALACGSATGLLSALAHSEIVDKVNQKLPKQNQFAELGWYGSKTLRLYSEYKRLYPSGHLLRKVHVLSALMFTSWLICVWTVWLKSG